MKKITLIIAIAFCIFQMIVLAVDIEIGSPAIFGDLTLGPNWTHINKNNPANISGKITNVEIYASESLENCEVATFYIVSENVFSTRDTHAIGNVTGGSKQTFPGLDITVEKGDYIGIVFTAGALYNNSSGGDGRWYTSGDYIPCTNKIFSFSSFDIISLCGTGEGFPPVVNSLFFGANF